MAEDIQIGADTSQAVANIGAISKAFEQAARSAQVSGKEMNAALRQQERATGTLVAGIARANASRQSEKHTISELITAEQKLAAAKRATANTGVTVNSRGQGINASSGQFVDAKANQFYQNQVGLAERLVQREGDLARQRERSARQQQLETVFAKQFYGVADQGAGVLRRTANFLQQIPPATWGQKLGSATQAIMGMSNSTRYAMYDVSNSFGIAGAAMLGFSAIGIRAAISHERAFANVRRTTQSSAEGYEYLRGQLERMASTMPVAFEELTNIATAAGQLGISASGVASFTSTVAKLSATTNLTSDAAGVALARFRAFFAESEGGTPGLAVTEQTFSNLASSILKVGVNSIATETGIVNVATQIASMGQYSGMTANQVIGLAGALSSIGVAPELARGTITRTFSLIGTAVSQGGERLEKFAALAGMTSDEFRSSWGTEKFAGTFQAMVQGLYSVTQSGEDANLMLMELGFNSVRDRPLLLRLAGAANEAGEAGKMLAQTNADAYQGWVNNAEMALQYSKISQTTSARIQTLSNAFERLFASMGQQTGGFLGEGAKGLTNFINGLSELSESPLGQVLGTVAVQATAVVGALALVGAAGARTAASIQGIGVAFGAIQRAGIGSARGIASAFRIMNLSLGIVGIVAAVAGLTVGIGSMISANEKAKRGIQDINGLVSAMGADARNGAAGIGFYADESRKAGLDSAAASRQAEGMAKALGAAGEGAESGAAGVKKMADESERAAFVFGDAGKAFYKSQLLQSEAFQTLFDPKKEWGFNELQNFFGQGLTLEQLGVKPEMLNWNKFMEDSLQGGVDPDAIFRDLLKKTGTKEFDSEGNLTKRASNLKAFAGEIGKVFGDIGNDIQGAVNGAAALETATTDAFQGMMDGSLDAISALEQMDDATQKAVQSMAQGFGKFTDISNLIKLTQQSLDKTPEGAAAFEKAWTDAYGGASFKIEEYLTTFRRAAGEQQTFVNNLQSLSVRGLSTDIIAELSAMGPEANRLVQALVKGTDEQLAEFEALWGQTGYDSMVLFAAQSYMAQQLVEDVMRRGGEKALRAFTAAVASGKGVDAALASVQGMLNAKPLDPKAKEPRVPGLSWAQKKLWEEQNRLNLRANVTIRTFRTGDGFKVGNKTVTIPNYGYADGGWTGAGSKYTERGVVHADEFVFTKKATNALGVGNLYRLMAQAERGRPAPRGRGKGYANGGLVGSTPGMGGGVMVVALSPEDRALLRANNLSVRIGNRDIAQAQAEANFTNRRQGVG